MMKIFKTIQKIAILLILPLAFTACVQDDDYKDPAEAVTHTLTPTLTISDLQAQVPAAGKFTLFTTDEIVEGYVVSNDIGGNIYKNMYIVTEDGKKGIQLSIDQSNLTNLYLVGKKVYIKLKGLALALSHDMVTIGLPPTTTTYAVDQIPPYIVTTNILLGIDQKKDDDLVIKTNSSGNPLTLADLDNSYLNTLVEISDIEFENAGSTFVRGNINTDNKFAGSSNQIARVSNFASFAGYTIPKGVGAVRGVYTKYSSTFQLLIRTIEDVKTFVIPTPPIFVETFNNTRKSDGSEIAGSPWPKIATVINFDNQAAGVTYTDPYGFTDIRKTTTFSLCVWLPANRDASLILDNINTAGHSNMILSFNINANIYNPTDKAYTDDLIVKCNDVEIIVPHIELNETNNKNIYYNLSIAIPNGTTKIEFLGSPAKNKTGFRLDDIKIAN